MNRDTGVPVFPVEERPVPAKRRAGRSDFAHATVSRRASAARAANDVRRATHGASPTKIARTAATTSAGLRNEGIFTPPSLKGSFIIPGNVGGMNWSGSAYDPVHGWLLVNTNNLPAYVRMIPRDKFDEESDANVEHGEYADQYGTPYGMVRTFIFAKAHRLPCIAPPWGTLAAVDMNAGTIKWQVPLGSLAPTKSIVPKGAPSLGGPIVTAGGLVFIAGTLIDPEFRAFNVETGAEVWKTQLPTAGGATPMTYQVRASGKQFVVIAAGGHAKITRREAGR